MNYTSTRYDGPYSADGRNGAPTHSASSSNSSYDGGNMAGVGSHPAAGGSGSGSYGNGSGNYGTATQFHQHQYDSSGEYTSGGSATTTSRLQGSGGPSMRAMVMHQQQQQAQMGYAPHHRHAQASDDYEGASQYASYNGAGYPGRGMDTPTLNDYNASTPRYDRDRERDINDGDTAFDFLLSPGLAPVGPISTSSSITSFPQPLVPPPPSQPPPALPNNNGFFSPATTPSRPMFNRSQTAMPASSASGRAFQAPSGYHVQQQQGSLYSADQASSTSLNASLGPSSHNNSTTQLSSNQPGREYTPPPAITAAALLEIVMNLRADQPVTSAQSATSSSSAGMSRSQSANASARLQQASQVPAHMRNISTGSNRSDDETGMTSSQINNGLQIPSGPMMARTSSSRNINDNSQTALRTIDLTHHRIAEVPAEVIDALEGTVGRLALGYNYIATLPPAFARLGNTLRYLNIRLNMLTTFPPVLCEMPSLEILDISRNKIKRLPAQCGTLKNLRVFSISKNRVKRLPTYFADMRQLRVLKIDHNPLEWPPREITTQPVIPAPPSAEGQSKRDADAIHAKLEAQALQRWLTGLQDWIRDHSTEAPGNASSSRIDELDSSLPSRSRPDFLHSQSESNVVRAGRVEQSLPPPIPVGLPPPTSPLLSLNHDSQSGGAKSPRDLPAIETDSARLSQHGRSESHSLVQAVAPRKGLLQSKKSLPDLRQNHAQILDERLNNIEEHDQPMPASPQRSKARATTRHAKNTSSISSAGRSPLTPRPSEGIPTPPRSASGDPRNMLLAVSHGRNDSEEVDTVAPLPSPELGMSRARRNINGHANNSNQTGGERATSGAYFKRLSMLPPSTISKAVPPSLLKFTEAIRGILFALSQIHTSLKNCVLSPAMDRLPAVFTKMMASADDAMGFLIDALDKFDSTTRRGMPDTNIVKDVIETCHENLTIFSKLVTIVLNQSKALFGPNADMRYLRTLVLGLYGGMGEVSVSWDTLAPLRDDVLSWLKGETDLSEAGLPMQPPTPSPQEEVFGIPSKTPLTAASRNQQSPQLSPAGMPLPPARTPLAKSRRQAGSFTKYNPQYQA